MAQHRIPGMGAYNHVLLAEAHEGLGKWVEARREVALAKRRMDPQVDRHLKPRISKLEHTLGL